VADSLVFCGLVDAVREIEDINQGQGNRMSEQHPPKITAASTGTPTRGIEAVYIDYNNSMEFVSLMDEEEFIKSGADASKFQVVSSDAEAVAVIRAAGAEKNLAGPQAWARFRTTWAGKVATLWGPVYLIPDSEPLPEWMASITRKLTDSNGESVQPGKSLCRARNHSERNRNEDIALIHQALQRTDVSP